MLNSLHIGIGLGLVAALAALSGQAPPALTLRFHHLHYHVPDPGAALGDAADAFKGTRVILQGLGVGVRVDRQYVLLDRMDPDTSSSGRANPADAYAEAVRWLTARGVHVAPPSLADTAVARTIPDAMLAHVAFAADDLRTVMAALGTTPVSVNDDRAWFRLRSGATVEIVRDTDRPDAFWCPMHPGVRSPGHGKCPVCFMALVPIPPPRLGEYKIDVTLVPRAGGGASGLDIAVRDPETGDPVTQFIDVHERSFHLFILSRDLTQFAHVHPERTADGRFVLRHDIAVGEYVLVADFLPAGGTSQLLQRAITTPGYTGPLFGPAPELVVSGSEQMVDGLRIVMDAVAPAPRRETAVRFHLSDASTGLPATDLEPYLGAAGHLLAVNQDLTAAMHAHPEGVVTGGPLVTFTTVFPAPGRYKMWAQFQRRGVVVTAPFVIEVPQP